MYVYAGTSYDVGHRGGRVVGTVLPAPGRAWRRVPGDGGDGGSVGSHEFCVFLCCTYFVLLYCLLLFFASDAVYVGGPEEWMERCLLLLAPDLSSVCKCEEPDLYWPQ